MFNTSLVYTASAIALAAGVILVLMIVRTTMPPARMTALSLVAGFCFGVVTNVGTALLMQPVDSGSVSLDTIRDQVASGHPVQLTGRAELPENGTLWIIVYRPSGGFEVKSRQPVPVDPEGRWTFQPLTVGQVGQDAGEVYTVAAVILDEAGAASLTSEIAASPGPADVSVAQPSPDGLQTQSTQQIELVPSPTSRGTAPTGTPEEARMNCPPAGRPDATTAAVVQLQPPGFPVRFESASYVAKLAGEIQLELGGQWTGSVPAGQQLLMLGWADPSTRDSTPQRNRGDGIYYRMSTLRVTGNCFLRPQQETAYPGAHGLTFRYFLVLVDDKNIASFATTEEGAEGFDDKALDSLSVTRVAYFDVPTEGL